MRIFFTIKPFVLALFLSFLTIKTYAQCSLKVTVTSPYPSPGVTYAATGVNLKNVFNVIPKTSSSVNYTHKFVFSAMENFTIKFGDGTPDYHYSGVPISSFEHTYTSEGLFVYELINNDCNASVNGKIYNGKDTEPAILGAGFPPPDNFCVPNALTFVNNSLGMSPFFEFDWDFGDTPSSVYDTTLNINNGLGIVAHLYPNAYSKCGIYVKFRVRKILPGNTFVTFNQTGGPYNFITTDVPKVSKSEFVLCEKPEAQTVELTDASALTCVSNIPRTIRWDIVEEPQGKALSLLSGTMGSENNYYVAANKKIKVSVPENAINGDEYKVRLIVTNPCGPDTSYSVIKVLKTPKPSYSMNNEGPICPGRKVTFKNTSPTRGLPYFNFFWEVYNDSNVMTYTVQSNNENVDIPFPLPGNYKVSLKARISSYTLSGSPSYCEAYSNDQTIVVVSKNVIADITLPKDTFAIKGSGQNNIKPVTVDLNNTSLNETSSTIYKWFMSSVGGDTTTFGIVPLSTSKYLRVELKTHGRYIFKLEAFDPNNSCTKTIDLDTVLIFPEPNVLIKANDICSGGKLTLRDSSKVFETDINGLPDDFAKLKVTIDFGDGSPAVTYLRNSKGNCASNTNLYSTTNINCTKLTQHTYTVPGNYWIKYTTQAPDQSNAYATVKDSVSVRVFAIPSPSFTTTGNGCAPLKLKLVNTTASSESIEIQQYIWNINGKDIAFNSLENPDLDTVFAIAGNYSITLKALTSNGCIALSGIKTIKVFSTPQFEISSNYASFLSKCSPLTLKFNADMGVTPYSSIDSAIWTFWDENQLIGSDTISSPTGNEDLETNEKFINTTFIQKKIKARLMVQLKEGGCQTFKEMDFDVNPRPQVEFSLNKTEGCSPLSIQFSIDSTNINPFTQYTWSFPGGSQLTSSNPNPPVIIFANTGSKPITSTIRLTTTSQYGCSDFTEKTITVYPQSVPKFNILNNRRLCSGESLQFENQSTGSVASNYVWVWSDGTPNDTVPASSSIISHKFENNSTISDSTYQVRLYALGSCVVESEGKSVTVERRLKTDFNIIASGYCSPANLTFSSESEGPINSFTWKVNGQALTNKSSSLNYTLKNTTNKAIDFEIKLITRSINGCVDSLSKIVTIYPEVEVVFSKKNKNNTSCSPVEYVFNNQSSGPASSYVWDFGDGIKDTVHTKDPVMHLFQNPTANAITFRITLTAFTANDCPYSSFTDILVGPSSLVDFSMDTVGCSPLEIVFKNKSLKSEGLEWDFGNGTIFTGNNPPTQIYINTTDQPIVKEISLKSNSAGGCENKVVKKLTIYPEARPGFKATPEVQMFPKTTVSFQNTSGQGDWKYEWNFGDGKKSTEKDPAPHVYKTFGNYNITLAIYNDYCRKEYTSGIKIMPPPPVAGFSADVTKGCRPLTVNFTNLTQNKDSVTYTWEFGDGVGRSQAVNPSYTFYNPGFYTIKLRVTNSEGAQSEVVEEHYIEVSDLPIAAFQFNRTLVHLPLEPVQFTNLSLNAQSYFWDFGDGNTSYEKDPSYVYQDTGVYTITLIAIGKEGCSDTSVVENAIMATSDGSIKVPNAFTPSLIGASSRNLSSEGLNDVFQPIIQGVESYEMTIYNRWGQIMYSCKGQECNGWNGYFKGKLCKQDVYIYNIKARLRNGETIEKTGDVLLLN